MAIPNPWLYFSFAQLQQFKGWGQREGLPATGKMAAHVTGPFPPISALEAGYVGGRRRKLSTIILMVKGGGINARSSYR